MDQSTAMLAVSLIANTVLLFGIFANRNKTSGDAHLAMAAALEKAGVSWAQIFDIAKTVPTLQHEVEDLKREVFNLKNVLAAWRIGIAKNLMQMCLAGIVPGWKPEDMDMPEVKTKTPGGLVK
jgi:hypothetical protein